MVGKSSHEQGRKPRADERLAMGIVFGAVGAAVLGSLFVAFAPALPKRAPPPKVDIAKTVREDIAADVDAMAHADSVVVEAEAVVARAHAMRGGKSATLPNGLVFRGEVLGGAPEGTGALRGGTTAFGAGFFVGGVRSGPGADCQRSDCSGPSYFGDYRADQASGVARIIYPDGSVYRGDVRDGAPDGFGELRTPDGVFYRGAFAAGVREGYGVEANATGPVKAGFWKSNQLSEELRS
jgi:hypothetical protein